MEEKKLTDEDIIAAYAHCLIGRNDCENCPYDGWGCEIGAKDIIDIVNRQKAEIERLTEENKHLDKLLGEKRLDEVNTAKQIVAQNCILNEENTELQKQVKELKANQVIECHGMLKGCDMVKQSIKDTAKEIWFKAKLLEQQEDGYDFPLYTFGQWLHEKFGVKVE